jgi:uncharacterized repeat protein (TIGR04076 family)
MKSCFEFPEFVLDTAVMSKICKYHKRKGQEYSSNDTIRDFCSDAFYVAYPSCLALLYGAKKNEFKQRSISLSCPNPSGIIFEVRRVHCWSLPVRIAKKIFEWVMAKAIMRVDWEDWHIELKVKQVSSDCPAKFSVGDTYKFNIGKHDELCPASFHGIYPSLLQNLRGHLLGWQKEGESARINCPDHEGMVYELHSGENEESKP